MRASPSAVSFALFAASALAATAYAPDADACGATPPPYVTVDRVLPATGTKDVAVNGAVLVDATGWFGNDQVDATSELRRLLKVRITPRGSQIPLDGTVIGWTDSRAIFQPSAPLAPSTTYDVTATIGNEQPKPAGNGGLTSSSTSFTTGTTSLAPLAFGGGPVVTFEDLDHEVCAPGTVNSCGACAQTVERRDRFAVLTLPPPQGGDAIGGFLYVATVTVADAAQRDAPKLEARIEAPVREAARLPVPLVAFGAKVDLCVETTVQDVTQKPVRSQKQCFAKDEVWASTTAAGGGGGAGGAGGGGGGAAGAAALDESGPPEQDPGCSVAAPARSQTRAPLIVGALLATLALGCAARRRGRGVVNMID